MSINLTDSIEELAFDLAATLDEIDLYANPFVLEQATEPSQDDWEAAWLAASNTLPIPEDQELYWKAGSVLRGQFGRINDRFYCIFPSNSVSLAGVVHFAYTKFLGWEDEQHFLFSGTQLNDAGQYIGLLRAYLDGTLEQVDFTGFSPATLLGYDESQGKLWYIEGTDLKRIDTTTEAITVIASGITVAPTAISFDGAGDAFCTINIGAGLDVYRWNNTGSTFTSFKASITVNGAVVDPGQVITASLNYVVVNTAVANYWVQIARAGGAEVTIKSNPAGATAPTLPAPIATAWTQVFAGRSLDVLSIVYTELAGTPGISEWRRTILWNMTAATYTEIETLPYDDFIAMCIAEAPSLDPLNYDARRDINYFALTSAYRKRVSTAWEYHNISGVRANIALSRQIIETDDGQVFVWSNESSGKIWRLSAWDQGGDGADAVVLGIIDITGDGSTGNNRVGNIDISLRPEGYDLIEVTLQSAITNGAEAVLNGAWGADTDKDFSNSLIGSTPTLQGSDGIAVDNNSYIYGGDFPQIHGDLALNPQSIAQALYFIPDGDAGVNNSIVYAKDSTATGVVNETVTYYLHIHYLGDDWTPISSVCFIFFTANAKGKYFMVRALRTEARRQGGSYYDPSMA